MVVVHDLFCILKTYDTHNQLAAPRNHIYKMFSCSYFNKNLFKTCDLINFDNNDMLIAIGLVPSTVGTLADTDFLNKIGGIIPW